MSRKSISVNNLKSQSGAKKKVEHLPVIEVVDGFKHFGCCQKWQQVLKRFNMTAFSGEIFALLGPHGCGKSTVINVVLGLKKLDHGQVLIFGYRPGHKLSKIPGKGVGYAPQYLGLYEELSIHETFYYYGSLLKLKSSYIKERIDFFSNLLSIISGKRYIRNCSESLKRQISFGIALLHEPELLILDEPTAGIDPVYRKNMWEHMQAIASNENRTILVATQSCEEANWADQVGIMRNGRLLAQGNPNDLTSKYKEKDLKNLYMKIYGLSIEVQDTSAKPANKNQNETDKVKKTGSEGFLYSGEEEQEYSSAQKSTNFEVVTDSFRNLFFSCPDCRRLGALIHKDTIRILRSYIWLTFFVLLPLGFIILFENAIGTMPSEIPVGLVNYEVTEGCDKQFEDKVSCQIISLIKDDGTITLKYFKTESDASAAAKSLEISGVLIIGNEFSGSLKKTMVTILLGNTELKELSKESQMTLRLDFTSRTVAYAIESCIHKAVDEFLIKSTKETEIHDSLSAYPLKIGTPIYGKENTPNTEYMTLGMVVAVSYYLAALLASTTITSDRVNKLTERNHLAGVRLTETLISQMITYGIVMLLQIIFVFIGILIVCDVPNSGNLFTAGFIVLIQIWCGLSFDALYLLVFKITRGSLSLLNDPVYNILWFAGIFISMLFRTPVGAAACVFYCLVVSIMLGGIIWTLFGLKDWMRQAVVFLPQTQAAEALRCVIQRGIGFTHQQVWAGIVISLAWMLLFITGSLFINKIIN